MQTIESLYEGLSRHYDLHLFKANAVVRQRVIDAIYRRTIKGQLDEDTAVKLLERLSGHTWSSWWKTLLGSRSKDAEIVIHVLKIYTGDLQPPMPRPR